MKHQPLGVSEGASPAGPCRTVRRVLRVVRLDAWAGYPASVGRHPLRGPVPVSAPPLRDGHPPRGANYDPFFCTPRNLAQGPGAPRGQIQSLSPDRRDLSTAEAAFPTAHRDCSTSSRHVPGTRPAGAPRGRDGGGIGAPRRRDARRTGGRIGPPEPGPDSRRPRVTGETPAPRGLRRRLTRRSAQGGPTCAACGPLRRLGGLPRLGGEAPLAGPRPGERPSLAGRTPSSRCELRSLFLHPARPRARPSGPAGPNPELVPRTAGLIDRGGGVCHRRRGLVHRFPTGTQLADAPLGQRGGGVGAPRHATLIDEGDPSGPRAGPRQPKTPSDR